MLKIKLKFPKTDKDGNYIIDKNGNVKVEEKMYANAFVTTKMYRRTLEVQKTIEHILDEELTDTYIQYICEMFHNQFSFDELYNGLETSELFSVFGTVMNTVINMTFGLDKKKNDEGNENPKGN